MPVSLNVLGYTVILCPFNITVFDSKSGPPSKYLKKASKLSLKSMTSSKISRVSSSGMLLD
jgi:hypothetical protein